MPATPGLARTNPRALLAAVAAALAPHGRVEVRGRILALDGLDVAHLNPSGDLVISPCFEGGRLIAPARNVARGETVDDVVGEILDRRAGRAA